jgi:arylformamidase
MGDVYDIGPCVSEAIAVFPGDRPYRRTVAMAFERGDHLALSSVEGTLHLGAHADAPSHYSTGGASIERRDVRRYLGRCQLVTGEVDADGLVRRLSAPVTAPRVLVRTGTFPDPNAWRDDFAAFAPELLEALANLGVFLIGIDTPSVDPAPSKTLDAHAVLARRDLAVLEGLTFEGVPDGLYTLLAAPLRLAGADAAPVRALLLTDLQDLA